MRSNPTRLLVNIAVLLVGAVGFTASASAETSSTDWQFTALVYGYLPALSGSATFPTGRTVNINIDPHELIANLNSAFMGSFEARKGPWGGFTDVMYSDAAGSRSNTRDLSLGSIVIPGSVTANLHLDLKSTVWTLAGTYRVIDRPEFTEDVLVGARGLFLRQRLDWQFSANVGPLIGSGRNGSGDSNLTNWDGIVGLKGRWMFGERRAWFVPYYFDVGAGASQLTYQVLTGVGYAFRWGEVITVWRYLEYHFASNDATLTLNGPAIGVAFHW